MKETGITRCTRGMDMGFTKITSLSLTDLFVQQVENLILSGELQPGDQLPPARELAARMGVSRPVVSAGLIELEKLGFVEVRPRTGAFVCDYRRKGTVETLIAIMRYNGGVMRLEEEYSLLDVRIALETLCIKNVVCNTSDEALDKLQPLVEAIGKAKQPEDAAEAVYKLHHELAVLSGNVLLPLMYHSFKAASIYLWTWFCREEGCAKIYEIKRQLYRALLNRDMKESPGDMARLTEDLLCRGVFTE